MKRQKISIGYIPWVMCGLLFLATTINYIDRQVLSILKPTIVAWPGWSEIEYGRVVSFFQLAYAASMIFAGAIIDRIGIRKGFAIAIVFWSLAAIGHAISATVVSFILWRILLGLGEAANFPASVKTIAEWFPQQHRALAKGIFNSGTNIGSVVGIGGAVGGVIGFFISNVVGFILNKNPGNYLPIFILAGSLYLITLAVIHLLVPKLEPAPIK